MSHMISCERIDNNFVFKTTCVLFADMRPETGDHLIFHNVRFSDMRVCFPKVSAHVLTFSLAFFRRIDVYLKSVSWLTFWWTYDISMILMFSSEV